jgi:diacylglycerol kinase family enzyme
VKGFLIVNPRSGDGSPSPAELVARADELEIACHVLEEGDDGAELARAADADALGIAGGDGSLAIVAAVAHERGLPFVCIPFGTRNHFARDVGLDRDDPLGALAAFGGVEWSVDIARVNDRVFLNNVSLGLYSDLVHRRERHRRRGEAFAGLRAFGLLLTHRHRLRVSVNGESLPLRVLLIANNGYDISLFTLGERPSLTGGELHLYSAAGWLPGGWRERTGTSFEVELETEAIEVAADGEPLRLESPLRFESIPRALRLLLPRGIEGGGRSARLQRSHPEPPPTLGS